MLPANRIGLGGFAPGAETLLQSDQRPAVRGIDLKVLTIDGLGPFRLSRRQQGGAQIVACRDIPIG